MVMASLKKESCPPSPPNAAQHWIGLRGKGKHVIFHVRSAYMGIVAIRPLLLLFLLLLYISFGFDSYFSLLLFFLIGERMD